VIGELLFVIARQRQFGLKNEKSPITNRQFFVLPLRLDPEEKALVIGDW
jgi:hypothetical protein